MRIPGDELQRFYASRDGRRAARILAAIVAPVVRKREDVRFLALGYARPLLTGLDPARFERAVLLTPEGAAPVRWPRRAPLSAAAYGLPGEMPFSGALFDQALVVHALEHGDPGEMLAELHRVLAPAGELILIVPNRAGLWTHFESTPFGLGRPYGRSELTRLLKQEGFKPVSWKTALTAPPVAGLRWLDKPLGFLARGAGGIHFVLARKAGGPLPVAVTRAERATRPALAPAAPAASRASP